MNLVQEQWRAQAGGEQQGILSSPPTDSEIIEIDNLSVWGGTAMKERTLSDLAWTQDELDRKELKRRGRGPDNDLVSSFDPHIWQIYIGTYICQDDS